ncbi:conserved hypothetical protein [Aromatoleum aromaticum EbN1]|uniref:Abortive infection bacteriophage resistance protein n=1 Tax=Aromatoleum aromaticum (strain DSM 19018 / LMG 30748 / EbN1) TaxID=76114 RepID=Q5NZN8_AROAE|nr:Abi family protein [Aromatoleum aromaticum]CAI09476.1 conserved hypothetical protein [Aromatoleum aromaticum EbN1]
MSALAPPKPFKSYAELVALLRGRGMAVTDAGRAERKLGQVGYYRLSGYWYVCRALCRDEQGRAVLCSTTRRPRREDRFLAGTSFDKVFELYLFDKRLRLLMLDAIERIEVHVRSVVAHEVGYHDPLAYQDSRFINPKQTRNFPDRHTGRQRNAWSDWLQRQNDQVSRSREDCIDWHRKANKAMPFWVVVEAWDFGTVSKYFEMLKGTYQNRVCQRLGINNAAVLKTWLQELNILRNRCAHHARIWNQTTSNPLPGLSDPYFHTLGMDAGAGSRLYGLIAVIWFLVRRIGPSSQWLHEIANLIATKPDLPGCTFAVMGFPDESGFPGKLFGMN